jgi:hypothetical protein
MRPTLLIAMTAAAALVAGQGFAQDDHAAHHPQSPAAAAHDMSGMDAQSKHEMCKAMMGKEMAPKAVHEHSREKSGISTWPNGKPLTKAEMEEMHEACAAKMAAPAGEAPKS